MARNPIKRDFRSSKISASGHFVKKIKTKFRIDLKWREMRLKVIFGHPKWTPAAIFVKKKKVAHWFEMTRKAIESDFSVIQNAILWQKNKKLHMTRAYDVFVYDLACLLYLITLVVWYLYRVNTALQDLTITTRSTFATIHSIFIPPHMGEHEHRNHHVVARPQVPFTTLSHSL